VGLAALLDDLRVIGVIEVEGPGPLLGRRIADGLAVALKAAGCDLIFREKASGGRWDRPELHTLLSQLRKGDVLVV